jgi:hypothetical protein
MSSGSARHAGIKTVFIQCSRRKKVSPNGFLYARNAIRYLILVLRFKETKKFIEIGHKQLTRRVSMGSQREVDVNGHKIVAIEYNKEKGGVPVVFIHGITASINF